MTSPVITGLPRRLLADEPAVPLPALRPDQLIGLLRASGLTGRGGAGFPVWRKLEAVAAAPGTPVVIADAAEGEPASGKDRLLLAYRPQLVLEGLRLVAGALGARTAHLYAPASVIVPDALLTGDLVNGGPVPVTRTVAPDAFVAGEESAVVAASRVRSWSR